MTKNQQIGVLIHKFLRAEIAADEQLILDQWISESDTNRRFFEEASHSDALLESLRERYQVVTDADQQRAWQRMVDGGLVPRNAKLMKPRFRQFALAAAVIAGVLATVYLLFWNSNPAPPAITKQESIVPGKTGAVLTLSDGRQVVLDSAGNMTLATQQGVAINNQNGQLVYTGATTGGAAVYNTLNTSRGQTYSTVLADGSTIWLNAASSIRYPVAFTGAERVVEISGEAYFEVAHNKNMPFKVRVQGSEISVTGTSFNVQAYEEEGAIRTSLVEGSVRVAGISLKPGQQAVQAKGRLTVEDHVDLESITAWKNNLFIYNNTNITVLMRQLERWYNVQVRYQGNNVQALTFSGQLSRYSNISEVMEVLNLSGEAVFTLQGNTVVVTKQ